MTLQQLRLKAGLLQEQVCKRNKITISYLSLLEHGKRNPSDKLKRGLARTYGVDYITIYKAIEKTRKFFLNKSFTNSKKN